MWLFKKTNLYSNISQRTGASAYATGFTLEGEAQAFVNMCMPHSYIFKDIFSCTLNRLQSTGRASIPTLHAQDTSLLAWRDVGRSHGRNAFLKAKILDAIVWTNLGTLPTANTAT